MFSLNAREPAAVERLLWGTGSNIDAWGIELYARLIRFSRHTAAALGMMARWDLKRLQGELPDLKGAGHDRGCKRPVGAAERGWAGRRAPAGTRMATVYGAGHLAHEEKPGEVAELIFEAVGLRDASSAA